MYMIAEVSQYVAVASFAEAWIEIRHLRAFTTQVNVASFAEAWIEITSVAFSSLPSAPVASFAEAWIEILLLSTTLNCVKGSPPSRRRGLKLLAKYLLHQFLSRLLRGGVD